MRSALKHALTGTQSSLTFWKSVLMRGMPRSHESSRSSRVRRRFCAFASCRLSAYSAHTRCESTNSDSQGDMYLWGETASW